MGSADPSSRSDRTQPAQGASQPDRALGSGQVAEQPKELRLALPSILMGTPREIMMRVIDGDPLGLVGRVEERARHHALLIDSERVVETAQARVAHDAGFVSREGCFAPGQELKGFVAGCVDRAMLDVLNEEIEEERNGSPELPPWRPGHEFLTRTLGIEAPRARKATLVFNHLAWATRQAFCAVMLEGKTLHRWVAEGHGPPERAKARIEHALLMLSTLGKHTGPDPDRGLPHWDPSLLRELGKGPSQEQDA